MEVPTMYAGTSDDERIYSDSPPPRVFFKVVIDYRSFLHREIIGVIPDDSMLVESDYIMTYNSAMDAALEVADGVKDKFEDSRVVEVDEGQIAEGVEYLYFVVDEDDAAIAGIAVETCDYRDDTIH